jgi:hypothetical protein
MVCDGTYLDATRTHEDAQLTQFGKPLPRFHIFTSMQTKCLSVAVALLLILLSFMGTKVRILTQEARVELASAQFAFSLLLWLFH